MKTLYLYSMTLLLCFSCFLAEAQKSPPEKIFSQGNQFEEAGQRVANFKVDKLVLTTADLDNTFFTYEAFDMSATAAIREKLNNRSEEADVTSFDIQLGDMTPINFTLQQSNLFGKNFALRELTENGPRLIPFDTDIAFKGIVNGNPNQRVRLTITDDIFYAWFQLDGEEYFVEPLSYIDKKSKGSTHIMYRKRDVRPTPHLTCGNEDVIQMQRKTGKDIPTTGSIMMDCFDVDFALAGAFDMISVYGSIAGVGVKMTAVTNNMEALYAPFSIYYIIVDIVVPGTALADPWFTGTCMDQLLPSFAVWAPGGFLTHDLGQLWVNRDVSRQGTTTDCTDFSLIGRASGIGTVCTSNRYNCCEDWVPSNAAAQAHLSAHECGHDWGGVHNNPSTGDIMDPSLNSGSPNTTWSAANVTNVSNHRDSRTCLAACSCTLDVDCSNVTDQNLSCRADLPPVDNNLPIIVESCGNVTITSLTIIPGNSGCPGDEISITRTYNIVDNEGNMDQCMQTFTIESNTGPTILCPAGGPIQCSSDIPPISAANATVTAECGTPSVAVSGPVVTGTPDCIGATYTYTYTVTDFCNRTASCEQVFVINSSSISISCNDDGFNVECEADIPTPSAADVTAMASCHTPTISISGPVVVGPPDCPGTTHTYTYTATSPCFPAGVSCSRTFTIRNDGPVIVCPPGFDVECLADITVDPSDATVTTSCMLGSNVAITGPKIQNGLKDCPGTTYTYYYVVEDDCGRQSQCDRTFTVVNDGPTVTCPATLTIECVDDIVPDFNTLVTTVSCGGNLKFQVEGPNLASGDPNCPNSVYELIYTVTDPCGRSANCTHSFVIDNADPVITECAPDRIVLCSSDIEAETDLIQFIVSCDLGHTITASPPVPQDGLGDCPGAQYVITYTLEDDCGRSTNCVQLFTIENNAPRVFPDEDQTVSCREDINPRWETCFVETDCDLGIVRYEIIGPIEDVNEPDCNGKIINYLYSVWDACGRMTCVAQAWTIENDGPTFDNAPDDVTVACSEEPDGLDVTASFSGCGAVTVDINDIIDPLGGLDFIIRRTFTAMDSCGQTITAEQSITVLCNGPNPEKKVCSFTQEGWGSPYTKDENGKSTIDWLKSFDLYSRPIRVGIPDRGMIIRDAECILQFLPALGDPDVFPADIGDVEFVDGICQKPEIPTNEKGQLLNTFAGEVIALKLNFRMNPDLESVLLVDICVDFSENILDVLPKDPTGKDAANLADATLGGNTSVSPAEVEAMAKAINTFFEECKIPGDCNNESLLGGTANQVRTGATEFKTGTTFLSLSPNPATDQVLLRYQVAKAGLTEIQIYNTAGQIMYQTRSDQATFTTQQNLDVANWPSGIYLVMLRNGEDFITKRLVRL